jgi:hypothetical protein
MKTLHKRCAGVDVHKMELVACLALSLVERWNERCVDFPQRRTDCLNLRNGWKVRDVRMSRWKRPASSPS